MIQGSDQKIALRKVPFVTGQEPQEVLGLLARPIQEGDRELFIYTAYEWQHEDSSVDQIHPTTFEQILEHAAASLRDGGKSIDSRELYLSLIPSNFFMWQSELEDCYWYWMEIASSREEWDRTVMLNWQPYLRPPYQDLVEECPFEVTSQEPTRRRPTLLYEAAKSAYQAYLDSRHTHPTARQLFDYLCHFGTPIYVTDIERRDDGVEWETRSGGFSYTSFRSFQNMFTRIRREFR